MDKIVYNVKSAHKDRNPSIGPMLYGHLSITKTTKSNHFDEKVRIGVSIKSLSKPNTTLQWIRHLERTPIFDEIRHFQVSKNYWFREGLRWIIPTLLFDTTTIKVCLSPSALLTTGFLLEIFLRDSTLVHEIKPDAAYGAGATIIIKINWNLSSGTTQPIIQPAEWKKENPAAENQRSVSPFFAVQAEPHQGCVSPNCECEIQERPFTPYELIDVNE